MISLTLVACTDDASDAFPSDRPYANLSDFDNKGCDAASAESLEGIWHFSLVGPESEARGSIAVRFAPDPPRQGNLWSDDGGPAAWFSGTQANRLVIGNGVLVRVQFNSLGEHNSWTMFGCHRGDSDRLEGMYAVCGGEQCETYDAIGYRIGDLDEPDAVNLDLVSEFSGPALDPRPKDRVWINVRYRDGYAYVVRRDWLFVVDVSDPAHPVAVGKTPLTKGNDVKLTVGNDGRLYAITSSDITGLHVIDVSDPTLPRDRLQFANEFDPVAEEFKGVHTLFIENQRAYITQDGVKVYDVSQPTAPKLLGHYFLGMDMGSGYVHDMFVQDGVVYLNYWGRGLVIVDMKEPASPQFLGQFKDYDNRTSHSNWVTRAGGRLVSVHGDESVGAHVRIVDVEPGSPTFMEAIGRYQTQEGVSVHNIQAHGELAFVTYYQDGLRVLDISDPTKPVEVAHFRTWDGANSVYGDGIYEGAIGIDYDPQTRLAYVVDTHRGLLILRLGENLEPGAAGCSVNSATPGCEWFVLLLLCLGLMVAPRRRGCAQRSAAATPRVSASHQSRTAADSDRAPRSA